MTTQVCACDPVPSLAKRGSEEAIGAPQVAHAWDKDDERAITADVVSDSAFRALQIEGALYWRNRVRLHRGYLSWLRVTSSELAGIPAASWWAATLMCGDG